MLPKRPTLLCILDGLGINEKKNGNAFLAANTPVLDQLMKSGYGRLITHGEDVGLPAGQMGNSEVGHLTIGAGRIIEQWLLMISNGLAGDYLDKSVDFQNYIKSINDSADIHLIGLCSDGGVHSHINHLKLLIKKLLKTSKANLVLHLITDGRDTSPNQSLELVRELEAEIETEPRITIASVSGRYHTMDRDKRWDRTELAYQAIFNGGNATQQSASEYIEASYADGVTDEFIKPASINAKVFTDESALMFWNFRADRMRQIVAATCLNDFAEFERIHPIPNNNQVLCFTAYSQDFNLPYLFSQKEIKNHLGEVVSNAGLKQLRLAETEKYPHVTYFLNGLVEEALEGESRELAPSPRDVKTYDEKPEMSAAEITKICREAIASDEQDLIVLNFANCDMVGHTGVFEAAVKAVETVDNCLGLILEDLKSCDGQAVIIADHGNAEMMIKADGSPHTAHTTLAVPVMLFNTDCKLKDSQEFKLYDIAPTILKLMGLDIPVEMTGRSIC